MTCHVPVAMGGRTMKRSKKLFATGHVVSSGQYLQKSKCGLDPDECFVYCIIYVCADLLLFGG